MANRKGSRRALRPKRTPEQSAAASLNPGLHDPSTQAQYELATFRAARKNLSPQRGKTHKPIAGRDG